MKQERECVRAERRIEEALRAVESADLSIRKAAVAARVSRSTLHHRLKKRKSDAEDDKRVPGRRCELTPGKGSQVIQLINHLSDLGMPLNANDIAEAVSVLTSRMNPVGEGEAGFTRSKVWAFH